MAWRTTGSKNWRLDGEIVHDPADEPGRFDKLQEGRLRHHRVRRRSSPRARHPDPRVRHRRPGSPLGDRREVLLPGQTEHDRRVARRLFSRSSTRHAPSTRTTIHSKLCWLPTASKRPSSAPQRRRSASRAPMAVAPRSRRRFCSSSSGPRRKSASSERKPSMSGSKPRDTAKTTTNGSHVPTPGPRTTSMSAVRSGPAPPVSSSST